MQDEVTETSYERATRLGVDLSWIDRTRERQKAREQELSEPISAKLNRHPLNLCWVAEGGTVNSDMMYMLVRYCRNCRLAEGVRLEAHHEDYPLVKRSELNIVTTGIPRACPAKQAEEAIKEYKESVV